MNRKNRGCAHQIQIHYLAHGIIFINGIYITLPLSLLSILIHVGPHTCATAQSAVHPETSSMVPVPVAHMLLSLIFLCVGFILHYLQSPAEV